MPDAKITPEQDEDPFALVDKAMLDNPELSWSAKGLMAYLSALPEGTEVSDEDLAQIGPDDIIAIRAALDELAFHGIIP